MIGRRPPAADPGSTVTLSVANEGESRHVVTGSVVSGPVEGLAVRYAKGTERTLDGSDSLEAIPPVALRHAVGFVLAGPAVQSRTYDLPPGPASAGELEGVPRNATVVSVLGEPGTEEPMRGFGRLSCSTDADPTEVTVRIEAGNHSAVGNSCDATVD